MDIYVNQLLCSKHVKFIGAFIKENAVSDMFAAGAYFDTQPKGNDGIPSVSIFKASLLLSEIRCQIFNLFFSKSSWPSALKE